MLTSITWSITFLTNSLLALGAKGPIFSMRAVTPGILTMKPSVHFFSPCIFTLCFLAPVWINFSMLALTFLVTLLVVSLRVDLGSKVSGLALITWQPCLLSFRYFGVSRFCILSSAKKDIENNKIHRLTIIDIQISDKKIEEYFFYSLVPLPQW